MATFLSSLANFNLFGSLEVIIPMKQVVLMIAISIFLILSGRFKTALIANLIFLFSWTCIASESLSGEFNISNIIPSACSYTVVAIAVFFGIALLIFYAISE
jgi:hypothetical protein